MLNVLLLCYGLLQGIQAILTSDLSHGHLQKMSTGLYGADRARYPSLLRKVKEVAVEPAGESCAPQPLLVRPGPQNASGEPPLQCQCAASLCFAGALPRTEFDQMALEVQEADGDLLQKSGVLEPQVMLCDLVFPLKNHNNKKGPGLL